MRSIYLLVSIIILLVAQLSGAATDQKHRQQLNQDLMKAIKRDDTKAAIAALRAGADANTRDVDLSAPPGVDGVPPPGISDNLHRTPRPTALLVALQTPVAPDAGEYSWVPRPEHFDLIRALLEKGADPNARCANGDTALIRAAAYGYVRTVRLLLDHGADVNGTVKAAKLFGDMTFIGMDDIGSYISYNGTPWGPDCSNGDTPLMMAAVRHRTEVVRLLLARGADVNARTAGGSSALTFAVEGGDLDCVKALLHAGAGAHDVLLDTSNYTKELLKEHPEIADILRQSIAKK